MFTYPDDLLMIYENEFETYSIDIPFTENRKNSFIDLLSYEKSTQDSDLDVLNIDHCSLDLPIVHNYPQEQVKLLLDDFTDFRFLQNPKQGASQPRKPAEKIGAKEKNEKIGTLTIQERVKKVEKYLEKKKKRTWIKKIHYNCRKRVADKRLRIKGRFVTNNKKK